MKMKPTSLARTPGQPRESEERDQAACGYVQSDARAKHVSRAGRAVAFGPPGG
jgi:hypothetical protein